MSKLETDIVMVTYHRVEITLKTIIELWERTRTPFRLLVVDNSPSNSDIQNVLIDFYREGKIHKLILLNENYGLERARNLLLPLIESKYCIFMDSDIMPQNSDPDWLSQLIELFEDHPEYGAIALRPQAMVASGNPFREYDKMRDAEKSKEFEVVPFTAAGYCRISLTEDIKKMGGWRNEFINGGLGHEENYLRDKMKELGKKVGYARDLRCWHFFGDQGTWGYHKDLFAGHRDIWPRPKDVPFDWDSCIAIKPPIYGV